jgi:hypothetical protein
MTTKRLVAAMLAAFCVVLGWAAVAAKSNAAPYRHAAAIAVSTANPACGGSMTVSGTDFAPNTTVTVTLHSKTVNLGTAQTDSSGSFTTSATLPSGLDGPHTLTVTDPSGNSASAHIKIAKCTGAAATGGENTGGETAVTGVAVLGIGAFGLLLLIAGAFLVISGRRRRAAA